MKIPTIVQNMSLFHARRRRPFALEVRFFNKRIRQLRKDARKKRRHVFWLRLRLLPTRLGQWFKLHRLMQDPELRSFEMRRNGQAD